jgi:hypothetical protein
MLISFNFNIFNIKKLASQVKELLPNKDINQMLEQLERFLDFMRITVIFLYKVKYDIIRS